MTNNIQGTLYGIGVGPGDPDLLTLKALKILETVPVVFAAGSPKNDYSIALETVSGRIGPKTETRTLSFPMTYDKDHLEQAWTDNARAVIDVLESGRNAAFLTIGDPLTYSTYGYLIRTIAKLKPDAKIETTPAVTAYQAAAARVNLPLVEGKESLLIISGVCDDERMKSLMNLADNMVILKTYRNFDRIKELLEETAPQGRKVLVSKCGLNGERIELEADALNGEDMPYLSLLLVKKNGRD